MLLIVEEGIRGGICQAIYRYAKGNNKYMDNYDQNNNIISLVFGCKQLVWMGDVNGERKKSKKVKSLVCNIKYKDCCSYKSFKTSIKSRISTKKYIQSNST